MPALSLIYRPQKVAELDHQTVKSFFNDLLKSGKVPQVLLFAGPRGTGKTSGGRILAKLLNCAKNQNWLSGKRLNDACGECESCRAIASGSYLDLIEIDAASNRGIDEIRNLRERVKLATSQGRYKVYLIDEVHMMTTEAFNALLKTLEEPPGHVYFTLATTEPDKLPETIRSRCIEIPFSRAGQKDIVNSLNRVIRSEKIGVEPGVIEVIAQAADGSFRDAQKWLERLSLQTTPISLAATQELLSFGAMGNGRQLLKLLAERDTPQALQWLCDFMAAGRDPRALVQQLLLLIHDQIMNKSRVPGIGDVPELTSLKIEDLTDLAGRLNRAGNEIRTSLLPQLPLELMIVEWGSNRAVLSGADPTPSPKVTVAQKKVTEKEENLVSQVEAKATNFQTDDGAGMVAQVQERWHEILERLKPENSSITSLLRSCRIKSYDGKFLDIEAFYRFHHERLQSEKIRVTIEKVVGEVLGVPTKIRCLLGKKPAEVRKEETVNIFRPDERHLDELVGLAEKIFEVH